MPKLNFSYLIFSVNYSLTLPLLSHIFAPFLAQIPLRPVSHAGLQRP